MRLNKNVYPTRTSLSFSISLFLVLAILKTKLYSVFRSYTYSSGILHDIPSVLFFDLVLALLCLPVFYVLIRVLRYAGVLLAAGTYICVMVFSALSTVTYLRLGAPINAGMLGDIKYDFLKSSIEQTTDIRLLLTKLAVLIVIGLFLPYVVNRISRDLFQRSLLLVSSGLVFFSLFLFAYWKADKFGEPDLWKTPVQSFVYPIWSEYKLRLYPHESREAFSFESPFESEMPIGLPEIELAPGKHNVVVYLMEGMPLRLMNEIVSDGNMPNVEKMLKQSILFTQYYPTAADSTKGMFSLLTSIYPFPGYKKMTKVTTRLNCQTLPKMLEKNGYRTAVISSGSFAWDHTNYFFEKIFQIVIDRTNVGAAKGYLEFSWGLDDQFLVDQLDRVLSGNQGPLFIILIPTNSHHPYWCPKKEFKLYPETDTRNKLKNSICYQDNIIGKVDKVLSKHEIADDTIIILTSDHSVRYDYDKGKKRGRPLVSPGDEQNAIPLLIHHKTITESSSSDLICSHVDIAPTVLKMLGLPTGDQFQGIDLFENHDQTRIHFIVSTVKNFNITLRDGEYQYYYDVSNNREAVRYNNLSSIGKEYRPAEMPVRSTAYKQLCIEFIRFQRRYLEKVKNSSGRG